MSQQLKAQGALEMVLVSAVILIFATMVLGEYFELAGPTKALIIAKNAILERQYATSKPFSISLVDYTISGTTLNLTVSLKGLTSSEISSVFTPSACTGIKNEIISKVPDYTAVNISINGYNC